MADFEKMLHKYFRTVVGNVIITDSSWTGLYRVGDIGIEEEQWLRWCNLFLGDPVEGMDEEWEVADKDNDKYYRIHTMELAEEEDRYFLHLISDVSDYATIFKNLSSYSKGWRILSTCQSDLMNVLTDKLTGCLPIVVRNLQAECAVLYVNRDGVFRSYICTLGSDKATKKDFPPSLFEDDHEPGKLYPIPGLSGDFLCFASGSVTDDRYGLYVKVPSDDMGDRMYPLYFNIFKLYIENALLREKIIYDSEHDHLTGLYNKTKYSELLESNFKECDKITIFNLDVNYLKRVNDTLGHQAGNRLLCMAAESLKAVEDVGIYAFRLGGDEFMMMACNVGEDEAANIEKRWRKALADINEKEPEIECVIACVIITGEKPYDLTRLIDESDKLMYADKRAIKISRGDDPDAR